MTRRLRVRTITATLRSGRKLSIPSWVLDSGKPGPRLLLIAAQHGNELQGIETIRRFIEIAARHIRRGAVFAVPFGNLVAIRERRPHMHMGPEQSYADAHGHNMNRTWPGKRHGNDSQRISYAIYQAFGRRATHALDLHTWETHNGPAVLLVDLPELRNIAKNLGHRLVYVSPEEKKHMLAGYFLHTGRIGITYEFSDQYAITEDQVRTGLRVVLNFAKIIGLLSGPLDKGDRPVIFLDRARRVPVHATRSGLFVAAPLRTCDPIRKGAILGRILSDRDLRCHVIRSPVGGYLRAFGVGRANSDVALPDRHPYVVKGERLASVLVPCPAK